MNHHIHTDAITLRTCTHTHILGSTFRLERKLRPVVEHTYTYTQSTVIFLGKAQQGSSGQSWGRSEHVYKHTYTQRKIILCTYVTE